MADWLDEEKHFATARRRDGMRNTHSILTMQTAQKRVGVKRLVKPTGWLEVYMGRGVSSTLGRFAGLRRCGLGAT